VTTSKSSSENVSSITFWMVMLSSANRIFLPIATQTAPDGCPNIDRGCPAVNDLSALTSAEEQQRRAERDCCAPPLRGAAPAGPRDARTGLPRSERGLLHASASRSRASATSLRSVVEGVRR